MYRLSRYSCTHLLATVARHQLNKKGGHSSEDDRQKLFTEACERYQLSGKILLADREFIGEKWLSFLVSNKIDFIIRMSRTCYKKPISESLGFVYSKLEKMALKARKTKKSILKQFQMKGNTYSVVIGVHQKVWGNHAANFLMHS